MHVAGPVALLMAAIQLGIAWSFNAQGNDKEQLLSIVMTAILNEQSCSLQIGQQPIWSVLSIALPNFSPCSAA